MGPVKNFTRQAGECHHVGQPHLKDQGRGRTASPEWHPEMECEKGDWVIRR